MTKSINSWYYKLSCGHIRLVNTKKVKVVEGTTEVYCRRCEKDAVVLHKDGRW